MKARAARGGAWLSGATGVEQGARLLRNIILARILAPADFGLMALVVAANSAFEAFTELGVSQCVVQNKMGSRREFLNAAWWFSALRGLAIYVVAMLSAPVICWIYGKPELLALLRVAFVVPFINGLVSPRVHVLQKQMHFGRWVAIAQGSGLLAVAAAVWTAFWLENVWALVIGLVVGAFSRTLLSFVLCPFLPKFRLDRGSLGEIFKFARGMFGLPILMMLFLQVPIFVVGKMRSVDELGVFSLAYGLASMPFMLFSRAVVPLMLPAFSELQDDDRRLRRALSAAVRVTALLGVPVAAFVTVFARDVLTVVYGADYGEGWAVLTVFAWSGTVSMVNSCIVSVFLGLGRPGLHRLYSSVRVGILLCLVIPFIWVAGIAGAAIAALIAISLVLVLQLGRLRKLVSISGMAIAASAREGVLLGAGVLVLSLTARLLLADSIRLSVALRGRVCSVPLSLVLGLAVCMAALGVGAIRMVKMRMGA
ncbi:MAG: oligosaccharide flippase family protein [Planctomycetes bacterium]|nr:oligosaccharide flippase family protein [Planctomycetota bacterium]